MAKPSSKLNWVPSDDPLKIIEPSTALKNAGYLQLEKPTYQNFNWFLNLTGKWLQYLEDTTDDLIDEKFDAPVSGAGANKLVGLDAAGTASEYKTIAATGPITITHAVGLVTIAMPAATGDAAGYVSTGTQDIGGDKYFLDDVSVDGNLTVAGNMTISGTLVYLSVENLQIEDKNIELNFGGTTAAAAGAGFTVLGDSNAAIAGAKYDSSLRSKFKIGATGSEAEILRAGDIVNTDIASGAAIAGSKIQAASASDPGVVTTGDQTFAGRKSGNGFLPAGMIMPYAGSSVPTGWLACDGSAVSQATYPDLFAAIGTNWNTAKNPLNGSTYSAPAAGTFRLPDLRSAFLRGAGGPNTAGVTTTLAGFQADTTAKNGLANSSSSISGSTGQADADMYVSNLNQINRAFQTFAAAGYNSGDAAYNVRSHTHSVTGTASAQTITGDAETRPDNVGVNYLIKT